MLIIFLENEVFVHMMIRLNSLIGGSRRERLRATELNALPESCKALWFSI